MYFQIDTNIGRFLALIINTLGVATDLNLLAFLANFVPDKTSGQVIMLIASLESAGTIAGVGILYPIYQWSMNQESLAGGTPYYICAVSFSLSLFSSLFCFLL